MYNHLAMTQLEMLMSWNVWLLYKVTHMEKYIDTYIQGLGILYMSGILREKLSFKRNSTSTATWKKICSTNNLNCARDGFISYIGNGKQLEIYQMPIIKSINFHISKE